MNEAQLIDRFIADLRRDPLAESPPGLDPQTAAFVRAVVQAEREPDPNLETLNRIWTCVLTNTQNNENPASINLSSSTNGRDPNSHSLLSQIKLRRHLPHRWRWGHGLTAIITTILFAGILFLLFYPNTPHDPQVSYLAEHKRSVIEHLFFDAWNDGNTGVLNTILVPNYVQYTPGLPNITGIDAITQVIANFRATQPNTQFTDIRYISYRSNQVEATLTGVAIQAESLTLPNGLQLGPNHEFRIFAIDVTAQFNDDGQITKLWMQPDGVGLWLQLVTLPVPFPYPQATRVSESVHIDTVLQLEKLLDSPDTSENDLAPFIDPALVDILLTDLPAGLPVGAERITARDDLVAVQVLFREDSAQPKPVWIEQITIYRFDADHIVEVWQFYYRTFTAAP